jgi:hypothetical protein
MTRRLTFRKDRFESKSRTGYADIVGLAVPMAVTVKVTL